MPYITRGMFIVGEMPNSLAGTFKETESAGKLFDSLQTVAYRNPNSMPIEWKREAIQATGFVSENLTDNDFFALQTAASLGIQSTMEANHV